MIKWPKMGNRKSKRLLNRSQKSALSKSLCLQNLSVLVSKMVVFETTPLVIKRLKFKDLTNFCFTSQKRLFNFDKNRLNE